MNVPSTNIIVIFKVPLVTTINYCPVFEYWCSILSSQSGINGMHVIKMFLQSSQVTENTKMLWINFEGKALVGYSPPLMYYLLRDVKPPELYVTNIACRFKMSSFQIISASSCKFYSCKHVHYYFVLNNVL